MTEALLSRRGAIFGAAGLVVGVLIAIVLSAFQTPQYRSSARVMFGVNPAVVASDEAVGTAPTLGERPARTELEFVRSRLVADEAESRLGYVPDIDVALVDGADVVIITATDKEAVRAQAAADTFASAYLAVRRPPDAGQQLETGEAVLGHIATIESRIVSATNQDEVTRLEGLRDAVIESYHQLIGAVQVGASERAQIIDPAELPESSSVPQTTRNVLLGALAGACLGFGAAAVAQQSSQEGSILGPEQPGAAAAAGPLDLFEAADQVAAADADALAQDIAEIAAKRSRSDRARTAASTKPALDPVNGLDDKAPPDPATQPTRSSARVASPPASDDVDQLKHPAPASPKDDTVFGRSTFDRLRNETDETSSLASPFQRLRLESQRAVAPGDDAAEAVEVFEHVEAVEPEPTDQRWGDEVIFR